MLGTSPNKSIMEQGFKTTLKRPFVLESNCFRVDSKFLEALAVWDPRRGRACIASGRFLTRTVGGPRSEVRQEACRVAL